MAEGLAHASHALLGIADVYDRHKRGGTKSSHDAKLLRFAAEAEIHG